MRVKKEVKQMNLDHKKRLTFPGVAMFIRAVALFRMLGPKTSFTLR